MNKAHSLSMDEDHWKLAIHWIMIGKKNLNKTFTSNFNQFFFTLGKNISLIWTVNSFWFYNPSNVNRMKIIHNAGKIKSQQSVMI